MNDRRRFFGRVLFVLVLAAGTFSWIQFLYPPLARFVRANPGDSFWSIVGELLRPINSIYDDMIFGGWLFLLVALTPLILMGIAWKWVITYIEDSQVAISVLETDIQLSFCGPRMREGTLVRRQLIHANQLNVKSYRISSKTDAPAGEFVPDSLSAVSEVNGQMLTKEILTNGSPKSIEMTEIYKQALPVNPVLTYLPNFLVYWLRGLFKRSVVERRTRACVLNEYNDREAFLSIHSTRFPVTNVSMSIAFPKETAPKREDIRGFLIKDNLADEIDVIPDYSMPNVTIYRVRQTSFRQASLRVVWQNHELRRWKKEQKKAKRAAKRAAKKSA